MNVLAEDFISLSPIEGKSEKKSDDSPHLLVSRLSLNKYNILPGLESENFRRINRGIFDFVKLEQVNEAKVEEEKKQRVNIE